MRKFGYRGHITWQKFPNQENLIFVLFTVSPLPKPYPQHTNMFSFLMNNTDVFSHKQMRIFILNRNDIHFSGYWYLELLLTNKLFILFFKWYTFPWVWLAYLISYWEEVGNGMWWWYDIQIFSSGTFIIPIVCLFGSDLYFLQNRELPVKMCFGHCFIY